MKFLMPKFIDRADQIPTQKSQKAVPQVQIIERASESQIQQVWKTAKKNPQDEVTHVVITLQIDSSCKSDANLHRFQTNHLVASE